MPSRPRARQRATSCSSQSPGSGTPPCWLSSPSSVSLREGFAFPSGHSMGSAATYGAVAVIVAARYPRWRLPLLALCAAIVAAVGVSRAYLGVHYPSDVLAGWALGATLPLWVKPLLLGKGFRATKIPDRELEADNFSPEELERRERSSP
ncbi:MAG: phosphatase PAP2 family protein [Myxococcota bacterium]